MRLQMLPASDCWDIYGVWQRPVESWRKSGSTWYRACLLLESMFKKELLLAAAMRISDFSQTGLTTTWT